MKSYGYDLPVSQLSPVKASSHMQTDFPVSRWHFPLFLQGFGVHTSGKQKCKAIINHFINFHNK